jgi:MFS family permease
MFGLSSSMFSLAYIIGPVVSGWLVTLVGEIGSFVVLGEITVVVAGLLLLVTPRKLRLPQQELTTWE